MTVTYRVLVVREYAPRRTLMGPPNKVAPEVLFEAAGPDAERLLAYAPAEVAAALAAAGYAEAPQRVTGLVDIDALAAATLATGGIVPPSAAPVAVDEPAVNPEGHYRPADEPAEATATDDKPKRKRRTRAEIEADNAAKAAAAAGTPAPVEPAGVAVTTTFEGAAPVPPAVATPAPVEQPAAAPAERAAPYNPFA